MSFYGWSPYVPVAERRAKAAKKMQQLAKKGHPVSPVHIEGRTIAKTFWGKSWCDNLESYSDYANRLPRGRTYVRNGSVVDLQIFPGRIEAHVSGSELYRVNISIKPLEKAKWKALCTDCAGAIDSLVELLQGRFSKGVMERVCQKGKGLFPSPAEISLDCSCPDWADMCKHVAAVLYGVGARLDEKPELLFLLRGVEEKELLAHSAKDLPLGASAAANVLEGDDLADLFGIEMAVEAPVIKTPVARTPVTKTSAAKTPVARTPAASVPKATGTAKKASRAKVKPEKKGAEGPAKKTSVDKKKPEVQTPALRKKTPEPLAVTTSKPMKARKTARENVQPAAKAPKLAAAKKTERVTPKKAVEKSPKKSRRQKTGVL